MDGGPHAEKRRGRGGTSAESEDGERVPRMGMGKRRGRGGRTGAEDGDRWAETVSIHAVEKGVV
jgi:hypothetical protein